MNGEFERTFKGVVVACFNALSRNLPERADENLEDQVTIADLRFEVRTWDP